MTKTSIYDINKNLTPQQRSENARKAALIGVEKRKEANKNKITHKVTSINELASLLGKMQIKKNIPLPKKIRKGLQTVYTPYL